MTRYGTELGSLSSPSSKWMILERKATGSEKGNSNLKGEISIRRWGEFIQRWNKEEFSTGRRK